MNLEKHLLNTPSRKKWERIGLRRRAGVLVPLFSVYSKESTGIGDLGDLKLLIDWAAQTGNSIIQLLPMNETGPIFCPYDSVSSFALEPAYICLRELRGIKNKSIETKMQDLKKAFPLSGNNVDYAIKKKKLELLWDVFSLEGECNLGEFQKFKQDNACWLLDFALYKVLKDYHKGYPWYEWEDKFKSRDRIALDNFSEEYKRELAFQAWLQWQLYEQFKSAKAYAATKKVYLKGDLPILVSRDSADAWAHPEFFKLEFAAGAPPDMYCAKGQRWGMPTYNWEKIIDDDYRYLREKLRFAQNFYDILRIDHVVGLFRIWSIPYNEPLENKGLNGFFDPRDERIWEEHGRNILSVIIDNTDMLLCAEDLGVIPKACTDTLFSLGIPGNDVQRWAKDWNIKHDFLPPKEYRELSVAMLSTHDTTNWPAWWENEAGTVDEGLFIRKCSDHRGIDFNRIRDKLFDPMRSSHGRLRWLDSIDSVDKLVSILARKREDLGDFIDLYQNSYREKEKLWLHFHIKGAMREGSDREMMQAALKISLDSCAIFCINTVFDWLYLGDILKCDPYEYRINTPGTVSDKNWSLTIPLPLEKLMKDKICTGIKKMISGSKRA
ncbi:MAG: 4-alpha-glucanotransferase [Candidatus Omnitrophica bacterium]|nr:4-alpha-glucanotransferase [Candidatus Omnitrophota bacterium]